MLVNLLVRLLPQLGVQRLRTALYRAAGLSIGPRSLVAGPLDLIGLGPIASRLRIGSDCWLNSPFFADLSGTIDIGNHVTIGHHAILITAHHRIGPPQHRAGVCIPQSVRVFDGAWLGACVTLLPGSTVGAGSVVGAGSLVTGTIPPGVVAIGRPARVLRVIDDASPATAPPEGAHD